MGEASKKKRVVSGMRPTGKLHIGHYFGALQNWVRLQNDPEYDCFYFIADWHALTSDYADTSAVAQNTIEIVTDYLAAGLDPKKSVIFQQSLIPEHAELHLLLSMVTPLSWLERVPTYKEAFENVKDKDLHTYGFLGYPCLQTADIVIYSEEGTPLFVPVGEDQVSHVELSREIVRRFNDFYGLELNEGLRLKSAAGLLGDFYHALAIPETSPALTEFPLSGEKWAECSSRIKSRILEIGIENAQKRLSATVVSDQLTAKRVLVEPEARLTLTPRVPGLDGRKMSKSYGNAITLSESDADIRAKTKVMKTDPQRQRRTDKGNPDVCPVYDWHKLFSSPATLEWAAQGCRTAGIGCIECKAKMADHLIEWIAPVRERRLEYEKHPKRVLEVIDEGSKKARVEAQKTIGRVREAVFGWEKKRAEIAGA
ncbi:MAG TPA: tryptophan--tRNA ligase [Candidatus Dormibacteraeota bacterium]|nr:tryptophan--tRNA ligase [Candidatus Dormibacteraeota bacterium]